MRLIDDPLAVTLWDSACRLSAIDRAVRMLASVAGVEVGEAADWPIDLRDRALIEARCHTYGEAAEIFVKCPHCQEALETSFDLSRLLISTTRVEESPSVRAPTSREVAQAARDGAPEKLLLVCAQGSTTSQEAVETALELHFPLLKVTLDFDCPACGEGFSSFFDTPGYLWGDIERHAHSVLSEVHQIASRYGWSEHDILAMSRQRRGAYLDRMAA